jgi:cellulose biosynthesis protein BcsQ
MKILSFNAKGGSGKSTAAIGIAALAKEQGEKCVLVDADTQKNAARFFARMEGRDLNSEDLIVGSLLVTGEFGEADRAGLSIIDAPPTIGSLAEIPPVDLILIPIDGQFAADGSVTVLEQVARTRPKTRVVAWANKFHDSKFGRAELRNISEELGVELFRFPVPSSEYFKRSELLSKAVWSVPYASRSIAVQNFKLLCQWAVDGCQPSGTYASDAERSEFSNYKTGRKVRI